MSSTWLRALASAAAISGAASAGCSAIVSPDTTRLQPLGEVDGGPIIELDGGPIIEVDSGPITPVDGGPITEPDGGGGCTGVPSCEGGTLTRCFAGEPVIETCALGCADGSRCGEMIPSNVDRGLWIPDARDVTVTMDVRFDTSACTSTAARAEIVSQEDGPSLCVLQVRNLRIDERTSLTVVGSRPLVIMATGDVEILGTLDVSAELARPGPGGGIGGRADEGDGIGAAAGGPGAHVGTYDDGGGGGGGFCGAGARGGTGGTAMGGTSGARIAAAFLEPLRGGSGGGIGPGGLPTGSTYPGNFGLGGAGGGAVQISAQGRIRVSGAVLAGGGGGRGAGNSDTYTNFGAGGGGGSGGGILIEAPEVTFDDGARIGAAGGGGGGGASTRSSGNPGPGGNGENGATAIVAAGGTSGGPAYGALGGDSGGGGTIDAETGGSNTRGSGNGGGGGGGAGCIVVRTADGALPAGTSAGWSPSAEGVSIAAVRTR